MTVIRPKDILGVLAERHDGILRAANTDVAAKLLRSMSISDKRLLGELREMLHKMAADNRLVIECEGSRFNLIATPEALATVAAPTNEGDTHMSVRQGSRRTTYPRTADGRELPAYLRDEHVGPLSIRYKDPETGEAIGAAAALVFDEIVKSSKRRYGRNEFLATIQGLLLPLYDGKVEVAQTFAGLVLSSLLASGRAVVRQVPMPGPGGRNEAVIEMVLPETKVDDVSEEVAVRDERDPVELLTRLASQLEAARERLAVLEPLLENAVDPAMVAKITAKAEEFQKKIKDLQRELEAATTEKERIVAEHKADVASIRSEHRTAMAALRKEHAAALAAVQRELEAALAQKSELEAAAERRGVSAELHERLTKLLGD